MITGIYTNTYTNVSGWIVFIHWFNNKQCTGLSVVTECDEFIWDGVTYDSTGVYTNTCKRFWMW